MFHCFAQVVHLFCWPHVLKRKRRVDYHRVVSMIDVSTPGLEQRILAS